MDKAILVLGGTGKTGRRVARRLTERGIPVRIGSRQGDPPFDWEDTSTWRPVLEDVEAVYITYFPDLAVPGTSVTIGAFVQTALDAGVQRLILLSGRGEEEARLCEKQLQESEAQWTIVRASWFAQNFSESYLLEGVLQGEVALPSGGVPEPFVDADDIAEVVVASLTEPGHTGKVYEVTGPRALTLEEAVGEIASVSGREIRFAHISMDEFAAALTAQQVPADVVSLLVYLFTTVLDGRNAQPMHGVEQALGRPPRDFCEYARAAAATGIWSSASLIS